MEMQAYEKEHLSLVSENAAECTVLLKTDGSFPLAEAGKIAAYGSGVRNTIKGGTGSGEVNSRFSINIEQGLKDAGFTITTRSWLDKYDEVKAAAKKDFIKRIKAEAKAAHANVVVYGMGKTMSAPEYDLPLDGEGNTAIYVVTRDSGEGNDRQAIEGDVKLSKSEIRDILALDQQYDNFMLVLNVGGIVDLTPVLSVSNILLLSQLGVVTGTVLADILLGKQNPSGKLATTWASVDDYCMEGDFGNPDDTYYKEGIYVGYRYFDTVGKKPIYPFGYGLSFTTFESRVESISNNKEEITVTATVHNTGAAAGKEVVEVYLSAPDGRLDKPYQELAAFVKTDLIAAGEAETVKASFKLSDMASYDSDSAAYILEKGNYIVRVGSSSADTVIAGVIVLSDTVITLKAKNVLGDPGFSDYRPVKIRQDTIPADATILTMNPTDIENAAVNYDADYPVNDLIAKLSDEELALVNTGAHDPKAKGFTSVIGNSAPHLAGGAGETTSYVPAIGKYLTMSDGPAGLRLAREYYLDDKGAHASNSPMIPESLMDFASGPVKLVMSLLGMTGKKTPKGVETHYQYATAIPIGTAIAQSFNYELAKSYGDMVGSEMEMFGVNLWLAPALNIHRTILCGRNFEYYSEDPYVSGMMAAAITEGVQSHKGCGTTIKHYAANNQEENRYANNSHVSERAMREIYLKGFGIAVRKSQPHAVMTSYNLLNGIHTSESRGLTEEILRNEYGYEGIVMTDWVVDGTTNGKTKYPTADAGAVALAGGDLFMPGSPSDYARILARIKENPENRKQVEINATRVYNMIELLS